MREYKNERVEENYYIVFNDLTKEDKKLIEKIKKKMDKQYKYKVKTDITRCEENIYVKQF